MVHVFIYTITIITTMNIIAIINNITNIMEIQICNITSVRLSSCVLLINSTMCFCFAIYIIIVLMIMMIIIIMCMCIVQVLGYRSSRLWNTSLSGLFEML